MTDHPNGSSFPPPATSPGASPAPFPPHDSLPEELVGEAKTDRPPANLDELRDILLAMQGEQNSLFGQVFTKLGDLTDAFEKSERRQERLAVETDRKFQSVAKAARDAADAALEAAARVEALRQSIDNQFGTKREDPLDLTPNELEERERLRAIGDE